MAAGFTEDYINAALNHVNDAEQTHDEARAALVLAKAQVEALVAIANAIERLREDLLDRL